TDGFLNLQCAAGTALAIALTIGFAPAPSLFLLWMIYLSLSTVCGVFLGFQWDILLLEVGFLAIFLAPLDLASGSVLHFFWGRGRKKVSTDPARQAAPSRIALWLLRWLLFRLMFESGCVKLLGHDAAWRNLTALNYHYETQPLPTWIGWYAHQLPAWAQQASTVLMFTIELAVPFLIFAPRRLRHFGCAALIAFQALIFLTGNYCFFNLLTIWLCLLLLDDAALRKFVPLRWRHRRQKSEVRDQKSELDSAQSSLVSPPLHSLAHPLSHPFTWPRWVTVPLALMIVTISLVQFSEMFRLADWTRPKA